MVMGFGWGIGGLALSGVGSLSDAIGIPATLSGVVLIPVVCAVCCLGIPKFEDRSSALPKTTEPAEEVDQEKEVRQV